MRNRNVIVNTIYRQRGQLIFYDRLRQRITGQTGRASLNPHPVNRSKKGAGMLRNKDGTGSRD
jgi:hypothetical protein